MFIKDVSRLLTSGAERARQAGYSVRYRQDRQQLPLSGWWVTREDGTPFQPSEIQRLIQMIRGDAAE